MKWVRTSKPRELTQREMDENYAQARKNCSFKAQREQGQRDARQRDADARDTIKEQRNASYRGATARMLWTTMNQNRLFRVFA